MANPTADAPPTVDSPPGQPDGRPGPDAPCVDTVVLAGGVDPATQGWTIDQDGFYELTFPDASTTQLFTDSGGITGGGTLVLHKNLLTAGQPFIVEAVIQVVSEQSAHMGYDAAVVLMGSYSAYPGTVAQRDELVYLDTDHVGWGDDLQSLPATTTGGFHTYRLAVDALGQATVTVDGNPVLTRDGYTTNGTLAIGDWTSRHFIEATTQLRSITLICPP